MGNCYGAPVNNHTPSTPASRNNSRQIGFAAAGTSVKGLKTPTDAAAGTSAKGLKAETTAVAAPSESESMKTGSVVNNNHVELKEFSLAELKKCTRDFRPDTILGEGGFGRVFKGWVDHETFAPSKVGIGMAVAVKKSAADSFQGHQEWQAEVNFLGKYRHPNLVRLLGYCCEDNQYLLVYEYMQKGSLENHLFRKGQEPLPWDLRLKIAIGAARGLAFLHTSEKVIYRDFKASNILLDPSYNAKLSDFGLAKLGPINGNSHVTTRIVGTYGYAAPEYIATGHLYVKSDVYGFGVVLLEMLTGLRALDTNRPSREHSLVDWLKPCLHKKNEVKKIMDPGLGDECPLKAACQAADLILKCLEPDPKTRPSMEEVVLVLEKINAIKEKLPKTNKPKPKYYASSSSSSAHHKTNHSSNKSPNQQRHGGAAGV